MTKRRKLKWFGLVTRATVLANPPHRKQDQEQKKQASWAEPVCLCSQVYRCFLRKGLSNRELTGILYAFVARTLILKWLQRKEERELDMIKHLEAGHPTCFISWNPNHKSGNGIFNGNQPLHDAFSPIVSGRCGVAWKKQKTVKRTRKEVTDCLPLHAKHLQARSCAGIFLSLFLLYTS